MTDNITIPRELLRQVLDYVEGGNPGHIADRINVLVKLRSALDAPAVEPSALVVQCGNLYAKVKLLGDAFGSTNVGDKFYTVPQAQQSAQDEPGGVCARCGGWVCDPVVEPAPVQEPEWMHLKAYGYAPGSYQCRCHKCGEIVYALDKRAITCRPCAETMFAQQPRKAVRKAVKLSDSDIRKALGTEYVESAQNRDLFISDIRAIEAAVWEKLGVEE